MPYAITAGQVILLLTLMLPITTLAKTPTDNTRQPLTFTLLHTNDEHSALVPSPQSEYGRAGAQTTGGIARAATIIRQKRAQKAAHGEQVIVVSAGDFISGSAFSWLVLQGRAPELNLMIQAGYDIVTLGNHEFDYGPEVLAEYLRTAGYPNAAGRTVVVASNTVIPDDHPLGEVGILPWHIRTLDNGLTLGFFGLMGKHADSVAPMAQPVTFSDQETSARTMVEHLRREGADVVILLSHSGEGEDQELAAAVPGIDIIIGGHTHTVLPQPLRVGQTLIVQTGTEFEYMGMLEMAFDTETGEITMLNEPSGAGETYLIALDDTVDEDLVILQQLRTYEQALNNLLSEMTAGRIDRYDAVIASSNFTVSRSPSTAENPLGNFIADAMRLKTAEALGIPVDAAFQASGVIRAHLEPSGLDINRGEITFYDFIKTIGLGSGPDELPGYPLVSAWVTGRELRNIMEVGILLNQLMGSTYFLNISGLRGTYSPDRTLWMRIPFADIPLPSGKSYTSLYLFRDADVYASALQPLDTSDPRYIPLHKGDNELYHIVSDYYITQFLPMVGEVIPSLSIVLKDAAGEPVKSLDDLIVYRDGQEYKVWQSVADYLLDQPVSEVAGLPTIDARYASTEQRNVSFKSRSLLFWPMVGAFGLLAALGGFFISRRRKRAIQSKSNV
jgi:2',3'-cyclic-nucleotide 2'-phosphodiesterase (5'-nucleotidase family)